MVIALSEAFAVADAILAVLTQDFVFASDVHSSLVEVLKLPECCIGLGYNYIDIDDGQAADELDIHQLIRIGG